MRVLVLMALAGFLAPSWAAWDTGIPGVLSQTGARAVEMTEGQRLMQGLITGKTVSAGALAGDVKVISTQKGPGALGALTDAEVRRLLPWSKVAKAVAKSLPLISTAIAIKEIADDIRCREAVAGGSECDPGTPEQTLPSYCHNVSGSFCGFPSKQAAAEAGVAKMNAVFGGNNVCSGSTKTMYNLDVVEASQFGWKATTTTYSLNGCSGTSSTATGARSYNNGAISTTSALQCPAVTVDGVVLYPVKGPDGKCMTNTYSPATEEQVATKAETWGNKAKGVAIVNDLLNANKPVEHPAPEVHPSPTSVWGPRETTAHPDGSTTVKDTRYDYQPGTVRYDWTPTIVTKDYPPGAVIPAPGSVEGGTSTSGGTPPENDIITCGLPNTPACKIDESGTPAQGNISKAEVDAAKASADAKLGEIAAIPAPAWTWAFALPAACSSVTVGPFLTQTVVVDLCEYQPIIHDLAALIWIAFTVWACVGMVGRTFATG